MYARAPLVGAPCARLECVLSRLRRRADAHARRCSGASATSARSARWRRSSKPSRALLFDCRMCGQCVLSSTGMSCPMNCPKTLRNGPCGGVRADGNCEVKPRDALRLGGGLSRQPAHTRRRRGDEQDPVRRRSALSRAAPPGCAWCASSMPSRCRRRAAKSSCPMRFEDEPVPGYPLPILPGHTSPGRFERVLRAGGFAVTTELAPPDSADPEDVYKRARVFDGYVDAINATDGSGANCHMSSLAVCALLTRVGYAPIMQISCRDKNRIAIQGDILGGAAMGVCNMLCLTGDGVQAGDHPQAKPVFDLDCVSLLEIARNLRDEHRFQSGRKISFAPRVFFGAAENPSGAAARLARPAAGEEGRGGRAIHPDAVLLRLAAAARLHGPGRDPRPARQGVHPGRRRPAALGEDGGMDAQERSRHARSRRAHRAARRRPGPGARRAATSASS